MSSFLTVLKESESLSLQIINLGSKSFGMETEMTFSIYSRGIWQPNWQVKLSFTNDVLLHGGFFFPYSG